jgi:molybdopterin-guanine dinucleotide biosynthesis protein A
MGQDKALVEFRGQPMVVHALRILNEAGLSAKIAGARSSLAAYAPVVPDSEPDRGPLGGICAALASVDRRFAVFLPVDMPLLPVDLLTCLLTIARGSRAVVVMASVAGFTQTFPAVIDRSVLPHLRVELEAGRGGCFSALQSAAEALGRPLAVLPVEGTALGNSIACGNHPPADLWFLNLNTAEDLSRAEACFGY